MSEILTYAEFISSSYMGSAGDAAEADIQLAIDIAEGDISSVLGYPPDDDGTPTLVEQTWIEQYKWPALNHPMELGVPRLVTVDAVLALHDDLTCDCDWIELTACAFIFDYRTSIVKFRTCERAGTCWASCSCPHRVQVTFTAGFAASEILATTPTGRRMRAAIALQARHILELLDFYTDGNVAVTSFSSLGYSEARDFVRTASGRALGLSILSQQAADLLATLVVEDQGPVMIRGH